MSIATKRGDGGQTSLPGGTRVSKADLRVDAYGTIDELISQLGFARSLCPSDTLRVQTELIQRTLFRVGSAIATPPESAKPIPEIADALVDELTDEVHRIEALDGVLADWSLPGADSAAAAFDVARTVCRRAERLVVRLTNSATSIQPNVLRYLNRLSDLLWLIGRKIEVDRGVDSRLREEHDNRPRWSRAW